MIEGIESAIRDILAVETEGATLIDAANAKATEISLSTAAKTEEIKRKAAEKDKLFATEAIKRAELDGLKKAEALIKENEERTILAIAEARKNIDKSVDEILRAVADIR